MGFGVWGLRFWVLGFGFWVLGLWFRVLGLWFWDLGLLSDLACEGRGAGEEVEVPAA